MNDLNKIIKKRREELGLSQDELAKKLGYKSRSTIAKIESGINDIPQSKIKAFADALETTPSKLMGVKDDIGNFIKLLNLATDKIEERLIPEDEREEFKKFQSEFILRKSTEDIYINEILLEKFNKLNEKGQEKAIESVDLLTKVPEYKKQELKNENE